MAEIMLVKTGNSLRPAYDQDGEALRKLKAGVIYRAEVSAPRDQKKHRKFFALLNLAFSYWEPETMVSDVERQTVDKLADYLKRAGIDYEAVNSLTSDFMRQLELKRSTISLGRNFDMFREHVIVASGFFELVATPAGPKKIAKSMSFANMDETQFDGLYRAVLDVCWQICLSRCFDDQSMLIEHLARFE